jgi:hypothetical protein
MVGGQEHAVYQQLLTPCPIKRAQIAGYRLPESDDAEELTVDRIGDGDGVRELIGCIDAVVMADRYIRRSSRPRSLSCSCRWNGYKG